MEYDTDTLDACDAYFAYLLPRVPRREPRIGTGNALNRRMRRKLHGNAVFRAIQLLNIQRNRGYIWLRDSWRDRLELAGIDPDSMQVVEPRRWARAWQLLSTTWRFRKADAQYGNTLNLDAPWPPEPVIRGLRKAPRQPRKEPKRIIQEPAPARKFDPISRFRRKIWTPEDERMAEPGARDDSLEYDQPSQCSMPIPDEQDRYGSYRDARVTMR
jgi:hypothetical protein